jgi:hypothetical protein
MSKRSKMPPCDYCSPIGGGSSGGPSLYDDGYMSVKLDGKRLHVEFSCKSAMHDVDVDITNCPMCGEAL